jgi:undecaprenyl-diphosphatase
MNGTIDWAQAVALGILQGLTEFLPISSSGHLVLGQAALGLDKPQVLFDVLVHVGTLTAVLVFYRKDVWRILRAWALSIGGRSGDPVSARTAWLILLGTLPITVIGLIFKDVIENAFGNPRGVSLALLVTGAVIFLTKFVRTGSRMEDQVTWKDALIIGALQAAAILPGISRSGATIAAALLLGIDREHAARFSFLLSIPAITGAFIFKSRHLAEVSTSDLLPYFLGTVAAALAGALALAWLLHLVRRGNLGTFAYYCWAVGLAGVLFI